MRRGILLLAVCLAAVGADRSLTLAGSRRSGGSLGLEDQSSASSHADVSELQEQEAHADLARSTAAKAEQQVSSNSTGSQAAGHLAEASQYAEAYSSLLQATSSRARFFPGFGLGFGLAKDLMKLAAVCFICAILLKLCGKLDCGSKKWDCRRCRCCGRALLATGYDEFEGFSFTLTVHSVQDVKKDGFLGAKEFKVMVAFNWSKFETSSTQDMRWEQTKRVEVPQGASECVISLYSIGKLMNSKLAECVLETKRDMLDKAGFWGEKQKIKLESKGKNVGTLLMTFRRQLDEGGGEGGGGGGGGGGGAMPITGLDPDSGLVVEVMKAMEEWSATPGFVAPAGPLEGDMKVALLAKVLTGPLRGVNEKGKETGQVYVRVIQCNFAELQGDDMADELDRQREKAKKKGLQGLERKWYWCWYEDKKAAEHEKRWHYPDGYIPVAGITSIHRSPERDDQFVLKYTEEKEKKVLIYRRESGKGLDVWVEGIDLCFSECRKLIKDKKHHGEKEASALERMRQMHQQWVKKNGPPKNEEQWTKWFQWFKQNNYEDELIRKLYQEIISPPKKK